MQIKTLYPYLLGLSIILEASAYPKPGNVHRYADLPDLSYNSFMLCGVFGIEGFYRGVRRGLRGWGKVVFGDLIYYVLRRVISSGGGNACLGSLTLLAPLSVSIGYSLRQDRESLKAFIENVEEVLSSSTIEDSIYSYRAIRMVTPSHIKASDDTGGHVNVWSKRYVSELREKGYRLIDIIRYSSLKEIVHHELVNLYPISLDALSFMENRLSVHGDLNRGIVETQLYLMSKYVDSLIARKHGEEAALWTRKRSSEVLRAVLSSGIEWIKFAQSFDSELRSKGYNPGSIADIVVSTIAFYVIKRSLEGKPILVEHMVVNLNSSMYRVLDIR